MEKYIVDDIIILFSVNAMPFSLQFLLTSEVFLFDNFYSSEKVAV